MADRTRCRRLTTFRVVAVLALVAVIAAACTNNPAAPADSVQRTRAAGFELPAEGFVSVSGGSSRGCGVRVGGSLQCWGDRGYGVTVRGVPAGEFTEVGIGGAASCGLRADASMTCWGLNRHRDLDVQWPPEGDIAALSTGNAECALRPDRTLVCARTGWGEDDVATPGGEFEAVSVGYNYACGIRPDRTLECWGSNIHIRGHGEYASDYVDVGLARPPEGEFVAVYAGSGNACAIEASGGVRCWGSNDFNESSPVPPGEFVAVAVGAGTSCGLRANGDLACWGWGAGADHDMPGGKFVAISVRSFGFCGLRPDGNVDCWTVGDPWRWCLWRVMSFSPFHQPFDMDVCTASTSQFRSHSGVRVLAPAGAYQALSARKGHTCALRLDGAARCWGLYFSGEVQPPPGEFTAISAGWFHVCGLRADGEVACWGDPDAPPPRPPPGPFTALSAGWEYTCGLRPGGTVDCWGREPGCAPWSLTGRVRPDSSPPPVCWDRQDSPSAAPPTGTFRSLAAGAGHACALNGDGAATCWGDNRYGQTDAPSGTFSAISAGFAHTCALRRDGQATCWGNNNTGQSDPPAGAFSSIAAGGWHSCGLRPDGHAACWGEYRSGLGQRGWAELRTPWSRDATTAWLDTRPTPPPGPYTAIAAGYFHTCTIRTDHSIDCWGD